MLNFNEIEDFMDEIVTATIEEGVVTEDCPIIVGFEISPEALNDISDDDLSELYIKPCLRDLVGHLNAMGGVVRVEPFKTITGRQARVPGKFPIRMTYVDLPDATVQCTFELLAEGV